MNKEKNFISAVIYVHNAENRIVNFLTSIIQLLEKNFEHSEIICVNDYSRDNSVQEIKRVSVKATNTAVSILNMSYFHGVEIAMNAGVDLAIGDFILEIDDTVMDYSPDTILQVYQMILGGCDIVSASPNKKQRFSSNLFYWFYEKFTADKQKLHSESFRVLSRRAVNRIDSMSKTIPYRKGLYANCGLKTNNFQYDLVQNAVSVKQDKQIKEYRSGLAVDSLLLFTDAGYFVAKLMTVLMMLISLFMIVYTVAVYMLSKPVEGWTTTILFLAVAFLGLFTILTIVIKYLQILVNLSFRRKKYIFESIEKLTK